MLDFCLKILYHIISGQTWSEADKNVKPELLTAKTNTKAHIKTTCHFVIDTPTPGGGNTNCGPVADKFFSHLYRSKICDIISDIALRNAYFDMLTKFNQLLSITQNISIDKIAIPEKVQELGQSLMVHVKQSFPWAMITPSVHQMCANSWELFVLTDGAPIAVYSEQAGEAWNKYIRSYKSGVAARVRQSSIKLNTRDVFMRMMVRSHPIIAAAKRRVVCGTCAKHGHTVRSCEANIQTAVDHETALISSCYR